MPSTYITKHRNKKRSYFTVTPFHQIERQAGLEPAAPHSGIYDATVPVCRLRSVRRALLNRIYHIQIIEEGVAIIFFPQRR